MIIFGSSFKFKKIFFRDNKVNDFSPKAGGRLALLCETKAILVFVKAIFNFNKKKLFQAE